MNFKDLTAQQLRTICKDYKIPLNGAKNKKQLLHLVLSRRQMFKPELPNELYAMIFIISEYNDLMTIRSCCRKFNNIINNDFWMAKIKLDYPLGIWIDCFKSSRFAYLELMEEKKEKLESYDVPGCM